MSMFRSVIEVIVLSAWSAAALTAETPAPVSPVGETTACPAFSWAEVDDAEGYELVVHAVDQADLGSEPIVRVSLPAGASSWTLPARACLDAGRYAWSVREVGSGAGEWADPVLLSVRSLPTADEVQQALDVLRRYREGTAREGGAGEDPFGATQGVLASSRALEAAPFSDDPAAQNERRPGGKTVAVDIAPTSAGVLAPNPATEPRSLSVDSNIELGASSNLFKDGKLLLWTDTVSATTAIGEGALASTNADSANDTAVGHKALANSTGHPSLKSRNTAIGAYALEKNTTGFRNTATGRMALRNNTTGHSNTAAGELALYTNTEGAYNTAAGNKALVSNSTGNGNTAVGALAMKSNTFGAENTATGYRALFNNTSGVDNTAVGSRALYSATSFRNTAVGTEALYANGWL